MDLIINYICEYFKIDEEKVIEKSNKQDVCIIRNYIYYILHYDYKFSISQIARRFNRCRREINYRVSDAKYRISYFKSMNEEYNNILGYIKKMGKV